MAYKFTEKDFRKFEQEMIKIGFRPIEGYEFYAELRVADVEPPSPRRGREEGFIFSALGLEVRVWTSFIMAEGGVRMPDSGWVVIREFGVAKYYAPQMYRTKNFFKRILKWARICSERIKARPICPSGNRYMSIVYRNNYQYYWKCTDPAHYTNHEKSPCENWDRGLSEESLKIVKLKRKYRVKYNNKRKKLGKLPFGTARKNRKPWRKRNSQTPQARASA